MIEQRAEFEILGEEESTLREFIQRGLKIDFSSEFSKNRLFLITTGALSLLIFAAIRFKSGAIEFSGISIPTKVAAVLSPFIFFFKLIS